ncbi:MAG: hypothetical protein FJ296_04090 [Planctomycetes bacterium]|nr:hypothetical protein [Planctomycetota bacterium]
MTLRFLLLPVLLVGLLAAGIAAFVRGLPADPPALPPALPAGGIDVLYARPFTLQVPAVHAWEAAQPRYDAGWVVVLAVDPQLVVPRQTAEPILYVGDRTAERVNFGHESGRVVAIVPSARDASGSLTLDLAAAPIFFGAAGLPEQVDAAHAAAELAAARARGVRAPSAAAVAAVAQPAVNFSDDWELRLWCSDLIERWSPQEADLVAGLRAPRLR